MLIFFSVLCFRHHIFKRYAWSWYVLIVKIRKALNFYLMMSCRHRFGK